MKLDETIIGYIAVTYGHDHQLEMYRSFELLDMFGNTYYDQEFIDFIGNVQEGNILTIF